MTIISWILKPQRWVKLASMMPFVLLYNLRSLILHPEYHDLHRFFSPVLFPFQRQTATLGFPETEDSYPHSLYYVGAPPWHSLKLTPSSSIPRRALPLPPGSSSIKNIPGKADTFIPSPSTLSQVQQTKAPQFFLS